jgi:hypothetical protein
VFFIAIISALGSIFLGNLFTPRSEKVHCVTDVRKVNFRWGISGGEKGSKIDKLIVQPFFEENTCQHSFHDYVVS